jgi:hypothetical protein
MKLRFQTLPMRRLLRNPVPLLRLALLLLEQTEQTEPRQLPRILPLLLLEQRRRRRQALMALLLPLRIHKHLQPVLQQQPAQVPRPHISLLVSFKSSYIHNRI